MECSEITPGYRRRGHCPRSISYDLILFWQAQRAALAIDHVKLSLGREGPISANAHNLYSSYREMLLEHLFAGAVMRHLWLEGYVRMELLKPQVDDSRYDLVLEAISVVRHVQLKASHHDAATPGVNINFALAEKPSGCVIWTRFDEETLDFGPFLWFGGKPGEKLPDLSSFRTATHTIANAQGIKSERPNIRYVSKAIFTQLATIAHVVVHLFGE